MEGGALIIVMGYVSPEVNMPEKNNPVVLYFISAIPASRSSLELIEATIDGGSEDWYRYAWGQWIIRGANDAEAWLALLRKHVESEGQLFIVRLDMADRGGWMNKRFWRWVMTQETRSATVKSQTNVSSPALLQ